MEHYRVVLGSIQQTYFGFNCLKAPTYQEGWWWICDDLPTDTYPYDPEGPFLTKQAARRHLIQHLAKKEDHFQFRGLAKTVTLRRRTLRPAIKHVMRWTHETRKDDRDCGDRAQNAASSSRNDQKPR